jgi:hypothetical protein
MKGFLIWRDTKNKSQPFGDYFQYFSLLNSSKKVYIKTHNTQEFLERVRVVDWEIKFGLIRWNYNDL